jgi:hypothetical protein
MHTDAPAGENRPVEQYWHVEKDVAATVSEKYPSGHSKHESTPEAPTVPEYLPGKQSTHDVASSGDHFPVAQVTHVEAPGSLA